MNTCGRRKPTSRNGTHSATHTFVSSVALLRRYFRVVAIKFNMSPYHIIIPIPPSRRTSLHDTRTCPACPSYHLRMCQRARRPQNEHLACSFRGYRAHRHTGFPRTSTWAQGNHPPKITHAHHATHMCPGVHGSHEKSTSRAHFVGYRAHWRTRFPRVHMGTGGTHPLIQSTQTYIFRRVGQ
jgi:hypothetical protein